MTPTRRSALVQLASMMNSAHTQLEEIYRAEQKEAESTLHMVEGEAGLIITHPVYELAGALQLLQGSIENMVGAIEYEVPT